MLGICIGGFYSMRNFTGRSSNCIRPHHDILPTTYPCSGSLVVTSPLDGARKHFSDPSQPFDGIGRSRRLGDVVPGIGHLLIGSDKRTLRHVDVKPGRSFLSKQSQAVFYDSMITVLIEPHDLSLCAWKDVGEFRHCLAGGNRHVFLVGDVDVEDDPAAFVSFKFALHGSQYGDGIAEIDWC